MGDLMQTEKTPCSCGHRIAEGHSPDEPLAVSVEEGARLLGLGRSKFYTEVLSGRCESVKIGERRLIPRTALENYIERLRAEARGEAAGLNG